MLLIFGISNGKKKLDFVQTIVCSHCGGYGRLEVFMTYMYFNIFFIPIFRWGKRFYVKSSCCGTEYELDPAIGNRILRGEQVNLTEDGLTPVKLGRRVCAACGYPAAEDFEYCPKCGKKL